jgi:outer membrane protein, heavy metal efflux system
MRSRLFIPVVSILVQLWTQPLPAESLPAESLPELVETALANNPELKASGARWQMYRARIAQAGSLDDPMLMLKIQNGILQDPVNFGKDPMTQKVIGISQQLPFWGKRALKAELATQEAEAYRWQVEERKLELARMVKETYYQLYATDRALAIVQKNIRLMDDFATLAENKYAVGQGVQQDVFRIHLEHSRMEEMLITLEQQRQSLQVTLNGLLNRPVTTPVGTIADFTIAPVNQSVDELAAMAEENRPQLKSSRALMAKGEIGQQLARKESYPDVALSFELMQRNPTMTDEGLNMYSLGLTFNLPVRQERRAAMQAESAAEVGMATAELQALQNAIHVGLGDQLAQMERRRRLVALYRDGIIPQAQQSLESATIAYRVSKVDMLSLLESRLTLFNYEREYYDALAEYQMRRAQLEALVGREL